MIRLPIPFEHRVFRENHERFDSTGFVVCAFFTPNDHQLERCAVRLANSCERFQLPYSIYCMPGVHRSISMRGGDDLGLTKPNFVAFNLERFPGRDVFYMDADTFFTQRPSALLGLKEAGCEFAVYNWLSDPHNDAYVPANRRLGSGERESDFYVFSHRVEWASDDQLICSGAVQYYGNSPPARALLQAWQRVIADNRSSADDKCLDFAYNNDGDRAQLRVKWLDKSHLRYAWWPHVEPVVLHPAMPTFGQPHLPPAESPDRRRLYLGRCTKNTAEVLFPAGCTVDTATGTVYRIEDGRRLIPFGRHDGRFWIYPEDVALCD